MRRLPSRFIIPPPSDELQHQAAEDYIRELTLAKFGKVKMPRIYASPVADITEAELNSVLAERPEKFERADASGKTDPNGDHWRLRLEAYDDAAFGKRKH